MVNVDGRLVASASDLNDFLACEHRVALNRRALLRGERVVADDPTLALIARKGQEHERDALARLERAGVAVLRIDEGDGSARALHAAVAATRAAMAAGAPAIYQAAFLHDGWTGRADLLLRVETASDLGAWSYDVADAKLAVHERAVFLVQLCTYARLVETVQGRLPDSVRALLGDGRSVSYDPRRFVAYVDAARRRFAHAVDALDPAGVPERIAACAGCAWAPACDARRRAADDLALVAGMRRSQRARLSAAAIATVRALGAPGAARPDTVAAPTFATLQRQATLQLAQRDTGVPRYELLAPRDEAGFALLPAPAPGDVYFDMEGDPFYEAGAGLEYLFGAYVPDDGRRYVWYWGETRDQERQAFEAFVDWLAAHRAAHPGAHVYHYAPYEKTALRRLAMQHGTREDAVDALLRGEALVDLYAVVRGALAQSHETYSIKKLETFYGFSRTAAVRKGDDSVVAFETYLLDRDGTRRDAIVAYNREDCVSTHELHAWLLRLRAEAETAFGVAIPARPTRDPAEPTDEERAEAASLDDLQRRLSVATLPGDPRRLLAHLLAYHRREDKPVWWALFDRFERAADTTFVDDDGDVLGGLALAPEHAPFRGPRDRKTTYTYAFPAQQHKIGPGSAPDPHRGASASAYDVVEVDDEALLVRVKRRPDDPHPRALAPGGPIRTREQRAALRRLGEAVAGGTVAAQFPAAWDILRRARPRITGIVDGGRVQPALRAGAESIDARDVADLALRLDHSALVVQGPPGTGKTYTGARVVAALLAAGKRVGITSTGHRAIHNLLHAVEAAVAERGATFRGVKKCDGSRAETRFASERAQPFVENAAQNAPFAEYDLVAGTSWLLAREDLAHLDVLVVDEAGQVALADALAMATNADALVLLGDPLQLAQVSQGTHPEHAGASVLGHLLGDDGTVADDRGVFLDRSFRMHPELCDFVSAMVYDGRLSAAASCAVQRVDTAFAVGHGLRYVAVEHVGNAQASPEEADAVADVLAGLIGGTFTCRDGIARPLTAADVLVVAPYNAHVRLLRRRLGARFGAGVRVGTVDKFQGQEAPVVIYSLATSSADEAPRGVGFLFEENRFNVAVSRGRALAVLVCSPRLLETRCTSVEQLRAVAAFCAFAERAGRAQAAAGALALPC